MRRNAVLVPLVTLGLIPWLGLTAQVRVLTLDSARAAARNAHPSIQAAVHRARALRADAAGVGRLTNPTLMVDREAAGTGAAATSQFIAQVEQPLDIWGRRSARSDAAAFLADAADVRAAAVTARIEEEVTVAFASAVSAGWREVAARGALSAFDRAVGIINERLGAGDASGLDARRLQLGRTRALAVLVGAQHDRHVSLATLAGLMLENPTALADIHLRMDTLPEFIPRISLDSIGLTARFAAGEVLALELESRAAAQAAVATGKAQIPVPSLRLGAKWERGNDLPARRGLVAGMSLPIPAWNGGGAAVNAARANADATIGELDAARRSLESELYGVLE
nr:TolC family protein [Gemmatimonadales bacterium]